MFEDEVRDCSQPPLIGKIARMFELINSMEERVKREKFSELMEIVSDLFSEPDYDNDLMMKA